MNIGELTTFRMGIEVTGGTAGAKKIVYESSGININNGGLFVADTGAVTIGPTSGLTTPHLLQSQATADYAVKIVNTNSTNGSGLRVQSDATGSTVQRWFCGTADLGSVAGTGAWTAGPSSGTFNLAHTINTTSGTTGGYLSINATGSLANGQSNRVLVTDNATERAALGVFKSASLTGSAGYLALTEDNVGLFYLWVKSGKLYISDNASNIGTATGTVVGTQT
jgi:hypothetical protein